MMKGGMGNLMKQAQMMQENMKRAQAELDLGREHEHLKASEVPAGGLTARAARRSEALH